MYALIHNNKIKNIHFFLNQICLFENPQTQQFSTELKEIQTKSYTQRPSEAWEQEENKKQEHPTKG